MGVVRQVSNIDKLVKSLGDADNIETSVGWFEGAKYKDGTPVAYVAAIHEHGYAAGGILPRPFMRPTIQKKKSSWLKLGKTGAKAVVAGNASFMDVMEGIGLAAEGDIRKKITQVSSPALKPATISARKRKLSKGEKIGNLGKPLVESGLMLASLSSSVKK